MKQKFSKISFRKFWSTSGGCPFSRKFGISGKFLFHLAFHFEFRPVPAMTACRWLSPYRYQGSICFSSDDLPGFFEGICAWMTMGILHLLMLPMGKSKTIRNDLNIHFLAPDRKNCTCGLKFGNLENLAVLSQSEPISVDPVFQSFTISSSKSPPPRTVFRFP